MLHPDLALWIAQQLRTSEAALAFPELEGATIEREDPATNATDITLTLVDGTVWTVTVAEDE